MSDKIRLENQDGKVVGVDPETGETVPIEIDETNIGAASIGDASVGGTFTFDSTDFVETEDINNLDGLGLPDFWHIARNDSELDDVMNNLSDGDTIYLGPNEFYKDRTFNYRVHVVGCPGAAHTSYGTSLEWTFNEFDSGVSHFHFSNGDTVLTLNNNSCFVHNCTSNVDSSQIIVSGSDCRIDMIRGFTVTFESGTSNGVVGSRTGNTIVNDNDGSNNVVAFE